VRRGATLTRALAAGALERAVDLAAALEVRGYGLARRAPAAAPAPWSRADRAFALAAALGWALALGCAFIGIAHFDAYPSLEADGGVATLVLSAALAGVLVAPFVPARRRGMS
jgi:energy-coupling factor transport system permease protein